MEENNWFSIFVVGFIVFLGLIYWFQLRPAQIRKECYSYAYGTPNLGDTDEWRSATNYYYDACLRRKGLEP